MRLEREEGRTSSSRRRRRKKKRRRGGAEGMRLRVDTELQNATIRLRNNCVRPVNTMVDRVNTLAHRWKLYLADRDMNGRHGISTL